MSSYLQKLLENEVNPLRLYDRKSYNERINFFKKEVIENKE